MSEMIKLKVDGREIEVPQGSTILQACEAAEKEIPRFCYHERLSIAGNCRMCLVEVENNPKPVASCAMPALPAMVVHTQTNSVKAAREGVMEFLLINHPLDCPICDQGGECDLQDQALGYGRDVSRFADNKRAVEEKNMGPFIKTVMTRCIHCTRCIRFASEVAGAPELGAIGRGEDMEVTTYLESTLDSELSGNVIDLCPVGALTSRPFAFTARPWELRKTESIDVMDAVGSNIRIDARGREIMRIMPRNHDDVNEEWISDKARFVADGLNCQRLDQPYIKREGKFIACDWDAAFAYIAARLPQQGDKIGAIAGDLACAESQFALDALMRALGSPNIDCRQDGAALLPSDANGAGRSGYLFNSGIAGIDEADAILLIGCHPRLEAPVLNARIRKNWYANGTPIAMIGAAADLRYPLEQLGDTPRALEDLLQGKGFFKMLDAARKPMIIIGQAAFTRDDGRAIYQAGLMLADKIGALGDDWCGFNILHNAAGRVAGLDLGLVPEAGGLDVPSMLKAAQAGRLEAMFLLGADEIEMESLSKCFTIYIGSHGDAGAHGADVILPAAAYSEKQAIYVNLEGRVQMTERAVFPPGEAREDWKILRALSSVLNATLPFDSIEALRAAMFERAPHLAQLDIVAQSSGLVAPKTHDKLSRDAFIAPIDDYFFTNPCARSSVTLAQAQAAKKKA